jgi:hypothetical protein
MSDSDIEVVHIELSPLSDSEVAQTSEKLNREVSRLRETPPEFKEEFKQTPPEFKEEKVQVW